MIMKIKPPVNFTVTSYKANVRASKILIVGGEERGAKTHSNILLGVTQLWRPQKATNFAWSHIYIYIYITIIYIYSLYICVCIYMCVCVCVCIYIYINEYGKNIQD